MAESCIHTTMPDEEPQTRRLSELRERIEHLEARVTRLEESQEPTEGATNGLDHRDRAVIETIRIRGDPGPRLTVDLYLQETDISKRRTAKTRAKTLRERPDFPDLINE